MLSGNGHGKFLRLALVASLFCFLNVVFGSYTRLSEAGLGCPDWPGCYGHAFSPATARDLGAARPPGREVKPEERAWREVVQRYLSGILGLLLLRLAFLGSRLKLRKRNQQVLIPLATMLLSFTLAFAGAFTVSLKFKPLVMMVEALGGMIILGALWWIALREQRFWKSASPSPVLRSLRPRVTIALVLVGFQIILGVWSMVNYAGLACPDFPTCQGLWWPVMDQLNALTLWRDVGLEYDRTLLDLPATTAIHMNHRLGALIVLLYAGWLALRIMRVGPQEQLRWHGLLLLLLLVEEIILGIMQVMAHLPLAVAVAHNAVSALLLLSLITLYHMVRPPRSRSR